MQMLRVLNCIRNTAFKCTKPMRLAPPTGIDILYRCFLFATFRRIDFIRMYWKCHVRIYRAKLSRARLAPAILRQKPVNVMVHNNKIYALSEWLTSVASWCGSVCDNSSIIYTEIAQFLWLWVVFEWLICVSVSVSLCIFIYEKRERNSIERPRNRGSGQRRTRHV